MNDITRRKLSGMYYDKDEYRVYSDEELKPIYESWNTGERYKIWKDKWYWTLEEFLTDWLLEDIRDSGDAETIVWAFGELDDIKSQLKECYQISTEDFYEWFVEILAEHKEICKPRRKVV